MDRRLFTPPVEKLQLPQPGFGDVHKILDSLDDERWEELLAIAIRESEADLARTREGQQNTHSTFLFREVEPERTVLLWYMVLLVRGWQDFQAGALAKAAIEDPSRIHPRVIKAAEERLVGFEAAAR